MPFPSPVRSSPLLLAGLLAGVLVQAPAARAAAPPNVRSGSAYVPNEVIVRYKSNATRAVRAAAQRATGAGSPKVFAPYTRVLKIRDGKSVEQTIAELERRPGVLSATPNLLAHASFVPNDQGEPGGAPGGWQGVQWNFSAATGVNAPAAWDRMNAVGRPGGLGVKVAVLDTGVAYSSRRGFRRSPDLLNRFLKGYDFVDDDALPGRPQRPRHPRREHDRGDDRQRRSASLASPTACACMPVRVLDRAGTGDSVAISAGIRYAARKGAKVINLSFEFDSSVTRGQIPDILDALRYARRKGALVVGASGNVAAHAVAYPARASNVMSVGATTEHVCQADYSNSGSGLDIVAPGGGLDADIPGDPQLPPRREPAGRDVYQVTFTGRSTRKFGLPSGYIGTSMAAPHVSATAALVIASGVIGPHPTPDADRGPPEGDRARPRRAGPGLPLRRRARSTRRARSRRSLRRPDDQHASTGRGGRPCSAPSRAGSAWRRSCPCSRPR